MSRLRTFRLAPHPVDQFPRWCVHAERRFKIGTVCVDPAITLRNRTPPPRPALWPCLCPQSASPRPRWHDPDRRAGGLRCHRAEALRQRAHAGSDDQLRPVQVGPTNLAPPPLPLCPLSSSVPFTEAAAHYYTCASLTVPVNTLSTHCQHCMVALDGQFGPGMPRCRSTPRSRRTPPRSSSKRAALA